jgi:hypothetical protein
MKKQKSRLTGRAVFKQLQSTKIAAHQKRPLHVHVALHPLSILALLCMGVLLVSFTINALADSYQVTAVIPAPPLTSPAVITNLANGVQTGEQIIGVSGTCPDASYIDLSDNGRFAGEAMCSSGAFRIGVELTEGNNRLQVQDYNITNAPGPVSPAVNVVYVPGAAIPVGSGGGTVFIGGIGQLVVTEVDTGVPFRAGSTPTVSTKPSFAGIAPPRAHVTVSVQSRPYTCTTDADALGFWSCTVPSLPVGTHAVDVAATTLAGVQMSFPEFNISVAANPVIVVPPLTPLILSSSYSYNAHNVGQSVDYTFSVAGGRGPYAVVISWGDGAEDLAIHQTAGTYTVSHTYGWINSTISTKRVQIRAIDSAGQGALLQLDTVIRNPAFHSAIAGITKSSGLWGFFEALQPWLWLLWPGYLVVLLLVFSFWLGEYQEMIQSRKKRRMAALKGKHRHAQAQR